MMLTRRNTTSVMAVAATSTALLMLTACSNGQADDGGANAKGADTFGTYEGLSGEARTSALVEAAKREGTLSVYATSSEFASTMQPAFEKAYPGIKLQVYRANSDQVRGRILQESKGGKNNADVVEGNTVIATQLEAEAPDLLYPYKNKEVAAKLTPGFAQLPNLTPYKAQAIGAVYNTGLANAADLPTTVDGWADSKWKGKLAVEQGDVNWFVSLYQYYTDEKGMTEDQFTDMMINIVKNSRVVDGHVTNHALIKSGEIPIFISDFFAYVKPKSASNGPVAVGAVGPVVNSPNGFMLVAKAKHPAAALLFQDWALTAGQSVVATQGNYTPTVPSEVPDYTSPVPSSVPQIVFDVAFYNKNAKAWDTAYADVLKGKRPTFPSS